MGTSTKIAWTDCTWTPIKARRIDTSKVGWHCERVSEACRFCYSAAFNKRNLPNGGTGLDYVRSARDEVEMFVDEKTLRQPLHWRKPRRVFVCSMTDLFAEFVTDEMIDRVFAVMVLSPRHTFQLLTKRPERMASYLCGGAKERIAALFPFDPFGSGTRAAGSNGFATPVGWPLPGVWLGVTAEDQETANYRVPFLLKCPAAVRYVSYEPAMGAVNWSRWFRYCDGEHADYHTMCMEQRMVDWLIIGTESGPQRRPMKLEWAEDAIRQCDAAGVKPFVKQLPVKGKVSHDPETWPEWARRQEFPATVKE